MTKVRTAKGRIIDMGALAKANEEQRAVGNAMMNARGDRIDASGNVKATVQAVARKQHENSSAPEKTKLSEVPGSGNKPKSTTKATGSDPIEMSREKKTRDDGSSYYEIEYDDGSIKVEEIDK